MNNVVKDRTVYMYVDWNELVRKYKSIYVDGERMKSPKAREVEKEIRNGPGYRDFYGTNHTGMLERLSKGYPFPEIEMANLPIAVMDKPRPRYSDEAEGEFDWDMYVNGETDCFLCKPKKESLGGIRMKVQIGFTGNVRDSIITEYFKWVGQTIRAIQVKGFDIELSVFNRNDRLLGPERLNSRQEIRISKFGEKIMPKDWSAYFSPGGHRHFTFLLYMWAAEELEMRYSSGLGASIGRGWKLEFDDETRTLEVHVNSSSNHFPAEQMTKELEKLNI